MSAIQSKAMLTNLSISSWGGTVQDRKVAAEVDVVHGATDAGRFTKRLVSKKLLAPVTKILSEMRTAHYDMTHAWGDNGDRLLSSKLFTEYSDRQRRLKTKWQAALKDLVNEYPNEVQSAPTRLGTLYDPADFPDPADLASKFDVKVVITPVPDAKDFRVDVAEDAAREIRDQITAGLHTKQAAAIKATYARVKDVVEKIHARLSDPEAIFKDTLIHNATDLCAVLDGLNITNEPLLTQIHDAILAKLIVPPSRLRVDKDLRARTAAAAAVILKLIP